MSDGAHGIDFESQRAEQGSPAERCWRCGAVLATRRADGELGVDRGRDVVGEAMTREAVVRYDDAPGARTAVSTRSESAVEIGLDEDPAGELFDVAIVPPAVWRVHPELWGPLVHVARA